MQEIISHIKSERLARVLSIQSTALKAIHDFMYENKVLQAMPIILSPITDPLSHSVYDATVEYCGQRLKLTKSMLMHKQITLMNGGIDKVYFMSPNVRLEMQETKNSGRHLIEFTQVDIEFKGASKHDFMDFIDRMIAYVIKEVIKKCSDDLAYFGRTLSVPKIPLKRYESKELKDKYGKDFERIVSMREKEPFWILDHCREFYDREDKEKRGYYHNYDLVWPEGYGEALSGGEREYEHDDIVRKMVERNMDLTPYKEYLILAKEKHIPRTVGGGLGIERMIRYLTGQKHVKDVTIFPRVPGEKIIF